MEKRMPLDEPEREYMRESDQDPKREKSRPNEPSIRDLDRSASIGQRDDESSRPETEKGLPETPDLSDGIDIEGPSSPTEEHPSQQISA
jgi:hypothetical protein